jgi:uncharacterized membrane protein HdeD (DUF308 family)
MIERFDNNWWLWSLRGLVAVIFGVIAIALPELTTFTMVLLFSGFMFADGIFSLMTLFGRRTDERWSWTAFSEGIVGIVAAVMTCLMPEVTIMSLLFFVGVWAVVTGSMKIAEAVHCREAGIIPGTWTLGLSGLSSVLLGVTTITVPNLGLVAIPWVFGAYAIAFGAFMILEGLRLKRFYRVFDVKKVHLKTRQPFYPA